MPQTSHARIDSAPKCTGALARDKDGKPCDTNAPGACRWCLIGAINASAVSLAETGDAMAFVKRVTGIPLLDAWFDDPKVSVRDVSAMLSKVIREAEVA